MDFRICVFGAAMDAPSAADQPRDATISLLISATQRARTAPATEAIDPKRIFATTGFAMRFRQPLNPVNIDLDAGNHQADRRK
jgi:hypothetical protein